MNRLLLILLLQAVTVTQMDVRVPVKIEGSTEKFGYFRVFLVAVTPSIMAFDCESPRKWQSIRGDMTGLACWEDKSKKWMLNGHPMGGE